MANAEPPRYWEWLAFVFDRPETGPDWRYDPLQEEFSGSPPEIAALFIHTMRHCGEHLRLFSDYQLKMGLEYLTTTGSGDVISSLMDKSLPPAVRDEIVLSISRLYADCFTPRCAPVMGHLSEPGGNPLNGVCYMFWDASPLLSGKPEAVIPVLKSALSSPNSACRESALHGLGHLVQLGQRAQAGAIVEEYLRMRAPTGALRAYAEKAARGMIQ